MPDVFYPIEDVVLQLCVRNPDAWNKYTNALVPSADVLDIAYDKWKTVQFAQNLGIAVPKTICPKNIGEVRELKSKWSGQVVIKPRKSSGSRGLRYVENPADLLPSYEEVSSIFKRPLIQDRIPIGGSGLGVFVLSSDRNEPLAVFGHKRLREFPISGGPSTLRVSYRDDQLIEKSIQLFRNMGIVGLAMAEYKFDPRINKPVLMEVNARFWGSLQLAISAGVDFPVLYHRTVLGMKFKPVRDYPSGVYCRWLLPGDILHFLKNPDRFKLQPNFFKFRGNGISYDILSIEDPLPVFGIFLESFRQLKNRLFC
jgi:predicted ATP-grasp superfamily ATP-dependent carboligase